MGTEHQGQMGGRGREEGGNKDQGVLIPNSELKLHLDLGTVLLEWAKTEINNKKHNVSQCKEKGNQWKEERALPSLSY